jgi:hypothetical protein
MFVCVRDARISSLVTFYSLEDPCQRHEISATPSCNLTNALWVRFGVAGARACYVLWP